TPFENDHSLSLPLLVSHAAWSLAQGAHYISPFGTTGEATSVGMAERMHALDVLAKQGVDPGQMMPGTGLCALPDTVELCRHATQLGCAAVMVLPPFYYPYTEDGLVAYYTQLIETIADARLRICLYHIPQMSGVAISPSVVQRLNAEFPDIVVAYKDSSGDWNNTKSVIETASGVSVFPASENMLQIGLAHGAAGCISATLNSQPHLVRQAFDALTNGDDQAYAAISQKMTMHRNRVQEAEFIPALKSMTAVATGDARWLNTRPPMGPAPADLGHEIANDLGWTRRS
ncbi:MAG: dihydrodipicolinate synthase family protein, partial [Pseudomonadota bacterium]